MRAAADPAPALRRARVCPGREGIENRHSTDVEHSPTPPRVCTSMRTQTDGRSCSDLGSSGCFQRPLCRAPLSDLFLGVVEPGSIPDGAGGGGGGSGGSGGSGGDSGGSGSGGRGRFKAAEAVGAAFGGGGEASNAVSAGLAAAAVRWAAMGGESLVGRAFHSPTLRRISLSCFVHCHHSTYPAKCANVDMKCGGVYAPGGRGGRHAAGDAAAGGAVELGRGLHSFTSQLNLSANYGMGGARRGCVAHVKGVLGGV